MSICVVFTYMIRSVWWKVCLLFEVEDCVLVVDLQMQQRSSCKHRDEHVACLNPAARKERSRTARQKQLLQSALLASLLCTAESIDGKSFGTEE